jgi:hypothetical protein
MTRVTRVRTLASTVLRKASRSNPFPRRDGPHLVAHSRRELEGRRKQDLAADGPLVFFTRLRTARPFMAMSSFRKSTPRLIG